MPRRRSHAVSYPIPEAVACHAQEAAENLAMAARLARDLPRALRHPIRADVARMRLLRQLASRDRRFLDVAERAIYRNPKSPYLTLLRHAGVELGDLSALVAHDGVEGTLDELVTAGVYVTYDELCGRRPAVRGSGRFAFQANDFDNPLVHPHVIRYTGGSTGPGRTSPA